MLLDQLREPIRRKLDACESQQEAWKYQHEMTKLVFRFEDLLGDLTECYQDIDRLCSAYAAEVIESPNEYDEQFDDRLIDLQKKYFEIAKATRSLLPYMKEQVGSEEMLEHEANFIRCLEKATSSSQAGFEEDAKMDQVILQNEIRSLTNFG